MQLFNLYGMDSEVQVGRYMSADANKRKAVTVVLSNADTLLTRDIYYGFTWQADHRELAKLLKQQAADGNKAYIPLSDTAKHAQYHSKEFSPDFRDILNKCPSNAVIYADPQEEILAWAKRCSETNVELLCDQSGGFNVPYGQHPNGVYFPERAAMFLYLTRHGYNGLCRYMYMKRREEFNSETTTGKPNLRPEALILEAKALFANGLDRGHYILGDTNPDLIELLTMARDQYFVEPFVGAGSVFLNTKYPKWMGGKSRVLPELLQVLPDAVNDMFQSGMRGC
ncbi:hypothetical protein SPFM12_00184 [Salmonella phage SPFM12]|nr:hypothetical protein SPFM12_00184 [Salmonella phage SPFM12]